MKTIFWNKSASKDFGKFPEGAQERILSALQVAAEGGMADFAKPMKGLGSGVFEVALKYRRDAYRTVYAVQIKGAVWVVHAFQKKSTSGIATAKRDIDVIRSRLRQLKE